MSIRSLVIILVVAALAITTTGCTADEELIAQSDLKLVELMSLPVGLNVIHNPVIAPVDNCDSMGWGGVCVWSIRTTVQSVYDTVEIREFGAFRWVNGRWLLYSEPGDLLGPLGFGAKYCCPDGVIPCGESFTNFENNFGFEQKEDMMILCYFIGLDTKGTVVRGEGIVHLSKKSAEKPSAPALTHKPRPIGFAKHACI